MRFASGILSSFCAGPQSGLFKALDRWGDVKDFAVQPVGLALPGIDPSRTRLLHLRPILIEGMPVRRDALSSFADLALTAAAMKSRGTRLCDTHGAAAHNANESLIGRSDGLCE